MPEPTGLSSPPRRPHPRRSSVLEPRRPRGDAPPVPVALDLGRRARVDHVVRAEGLAPNARGSAWERAGRTSVEASTRAHRDAIDVEGVGIYYGAKSSLRGADKKDGRALRAEFVRKHAREGADLDRIEARLTKTSCIGWAMKHVKAAYVGAKRAARWKEIESVVRKEDLRGTTLARELSKDGWTVVLYAPDARGGGDPHAARALRTGRYHGVRVDDRIIGLSAREASGAERERLQAAGFFFGLKESGIHTFVGSDGRVSEFHWNAAPNDPSAMSEKAAESFLRTSGLLVFPPGAWPSKGSSPAPARVGG